MCYWMMAVNVRSTVLLRTTSGRNINGPLECQAMPAVGLGRSLKLLFTGCPQNQAM